MSDLFPSKQCFKHMSVGTGIAIVGIWLICLTFVPIVMIYMMRVSGMIGTFDTTMRFQPIFDFIDLMLTLVPIVPAIMGALIGTEKLLDSVPPHRHDG